jgi:hypothetical protein
VYETRPTNIPQQNNVFGCVKIALEGKLGGRRKRGKPRRRWTDNVEDDLRKMGIKSWTSGTADRREWTGIC